PAQIDVDPSGCRGELGCGPEVHEIVGGGSDAPGRPEAQEHIAVGVSGFRGSRNRTDNSRHSGHDGAGGARRMREHFHDLGLVVNLVCRRKTAVTVPCRPCQEQGTESYISMPDTLPLRANHVSAWGRLCEEMQ